MISDREIYEGLAEIFADVFMRDDIPLSAALSAADVADWDSFKQIEIVMATEERFGVKFTSAELDNMRQLGDLVRIVAARGTPPS
ncbi:acyl carrier protein [Reyranella sp. CPCC 100927]|uniref:acyl carrier protein n=1 Tax=Reyranella sp. CPCC 100927 TaxID=2599616 RepID=UPI0021049BE8|nr:acyl carrier protein [Reyranella sp. CPCC 100927]